MGGRRCQVFRSSRLKLAASHEGGLKGNQSMLSIMSFCMLSLHDGRPHSQTCPRDANNCVDGCIAEPSPAVCCRPRVMAGIYTAPCLRQHEALARYWSRCVLSAMTPSSCRLVRQLNGGVHHTPRTPLAAGPWPCASCCRWDGGNMRRCGRVGTGVRGVRNKQCGTDKPLLGTKPDILSALHNKVSRPLSGCVTS